MSILSERTFQRGQLGGSLEHLWIHTPPVLVGTNQDCRVAVANLLVEGRYGLGYHGIIAQLNGIGMSAWPHLNNGI